MKYIKNILLNKSAILWHLKMIWKNYIAIKDEPTVYMDHLSISDLELRASRQSPEVFAQERLQHEYDENRLKLGSYMREVGKPEWFSKDDYEYKRKIFGWKTHFISRGKRAK